MNNLEHIEMKTMLRRYFFSSKNPNLLDMGLQQRDMTVSTKSQEMLLS